MRGRQPGGAHRDCDARRSMKNNAACHGCRSHTPVDAVYRYIRKGVAADASVHDGKVPARPLPKDGRERGGLFAGSACRSAETGGIKGQAHGVRDLRAGVRRASPCRKAKRKNGRKSKTRRRTGHACGARKGGGQRRFFTAWGLPAPKCTWGQWTPPATSAGFAI